MRTLTHQQFLQKIPQDIIVLGEYKNSRTRIDVKCTTCSFVWSPIANSLLHKHGCPHCGQDTAKETVKWNITQEQFLSKIPNDLASKIEVIGSYSSVHADMLVRCRRCGRSWESSPYKLYRSQGCDSCAKKDNGKQNRKTHDQFLQEVNATHFGSILLLEDYQTGKHRIKVQCCQCDHVWTPMAQRLLRRGCPKCISSKGEKKIERILIENHIPYKRQFSFFDLPKLRFDFAIFQKDGSLKRVVEYDGQQHFKPVKSWGGEKRYKKQVENDARKNKYCIDNAIDLVRIPYTKYNEISLEMLA